MFKTKLFTYLILLALFTVKSYSQKIQIEDRKKLEGIEAILKIYSDSIVNSSDAETRFSNARQMIQGLVQALKVNHSFYYAFDSVRMAKVYSPDSTFRIYTWQVSKDSNTYRQYGAIQMNTNDGSLKLYPLFDASDFTDRPTDSIRGIDKWIGAVYYKVILKTYNNKKIYTLLGSDANNYTSNIKWMEILTFDKEGKPIFGGNYFVYRNDGVKPPQPCFRFNIEYKRNGGVRLMYNEKLDVVLFDHIVSETNDIAVKASMIPYGDYEGFKWNNGKWYFTAQPFDALDFDKNPTKTIPKPLKFEKEKN
jgi:hypothetical protein